jgi:methionine sulfoxide reductase catalytic subunit
MSAGWQTALGSADKVPIQLFNGYGELVAGLYAGVETETLFA